MTDSAPKRRSLRSSLLSVTLVVIAFACASLVFVLQPRNGDEEVVEVPSRLEVRTHLLERQPIPNDVEISGFLRPHRSVDLMLEESGYVVTKPHEEGVEVASGELILALDTDMISAQIAQSDADMEQARRTQDLARLRLERMRALIADQVVSEDDLDDAEAAYEVARAAVESRRAGREMQRVHLNRHQLVAPMSGVLTRLAPEVGSQVSIGEVVGRLDELNVLEAALMVAPEVRSLLSLGDEVELWPDTSPDQVHRGTITRLDQVADEMTRKFEIEIQVDNTDRSLLAGSPVRCRLPLGRPDEVLLIPEDWTVGMFSARYAYAVRASGETSHIAELTEIETRPIREVPGALEIVSGLEPGAEVVIERLTDLSPGQEIIPNRTQAVVRQGG